VGLHEVGYILPNLLTISFSIRTLIHRVINIYMKYISKEKRTSRWLRTETSICNKTWRRSIISVHGRLWEFTRSIPYQGSSPYSEECEKCMVILEYPHCHTRYVLHIHQVPLGSIWHQQNHHHCHGNQFLLVMDLQYWSLSTESSFSLTCSELTTLPNPNITLFPTLYCKGWFCSVVCWTWAFLGGF